MVWYKYLWIVEAIVNLIKEIVKRKEEDDEDNNGETEKTTESATIMRGPYSNRTESQGQSEHKQNNG